MNLRQIKYVVLLILGMITFQTHSQVWKNIDANWVSRPHFHLNFMGSFPDTLMGTQIESAPNTISVSDYNGNLLFYSDGIHVWNTNNTIMPWSQAASPGGTLNYPYSSTIPYLTNQWCRINALHVPLCIDKYYVFTNAYNSNLTELDSYYTEIDMSYGMGLGDINPLKKNILFETNVLRDLYIVNHQNGYDQWVILHKSGTDTILAYLLTENDFTDLVISKTGPIITTNLPFTNPWSTSETCYSSPNGEFLILSQITSSFPNVTNLYSFDDSTGRVIHIMNLDSLNIANWVQSYLEFSPNSQYVYYNGPSGIPHKIDVSSGIPAQILSSITAFPIPFNKTYSRFRTAIDGKMYFIAHYNFGSSGADSYGLGRFENPDAPGITVGIQDSLFNLSTPSAAFPKKAVGWYWNIAGFEHQGVCHGDTTFFQTNRPEIYLDSVNYNFGDPASGPLNFSQEFNPSHYYSQPGVYDVEIITYRMDIPDTALVSIEIFANPISALPGDSSFCAGSEISLSAGPFNPDYLYLWNNHPDSSTITVQPMQTQIVQLEIVDTLTACTTLDSILLLPYPLTAAFDVETPYCPDQELEIMYTGNASSTASFHWDFTGASHLSGAGQGPHVITYPTAGSYPISLHLMQDQCYSDTLTQTITIPDYLSIQSTMNHASCFGFADGIIQIDTAGSNVNFTFLWNTGETISSIENLPANWYYLTLTYQTDCLIQDSMLLEQPDPIVVASQISPLTAPDSEDASIQVFPGGGTPPYSYFWHTGATTSSLEGLTAETYYLTITDNQACEWDSSFVVEEFIVIDANYAQNPIKLYPNPGKDMITIEWQIQPLDAIFQLYDANGRLVIEKAIHWASSSVNTAALCLGSYTWLIKQEDKLIAQGIWVKR